MAKHVMLLKYTDKGIANVQGSPDRAEAFLSAAQKLGVKVERFLWMSGPYDCIAIVDAPTDEAVASLSLGTAKLGNVSTCTCRAYDSAEFRKIVEKI